MVLKGTLIQCFLNYESRNPQVRRELIFGDHEGESDMYNNKCYGHGDQCNTIISTVNSYVCQRIKWD